MYGKKLLICFATLLYSYNAAAFLGELTGAAGGVFGLGGGLTGGASGGAGGVGGLTGGAGGLTDGIGGVAGGAGGLTGGLGGVAGGAGGLTGGLGGVAGGAGGLTGGVSGVAGGAGGLTGGLGGLGGGLGGLGGGLGGLGGGAGGIGGLAGGLSGGLSIFSIKPCTAAEGCKGILAGAFELQYVSLLKVFLSQVLTALESVAIELRGNFDVDSSTYAKLNAIADASKQSRIILENPGELTTEKLGELIVRVQAHLHEIHSISKDSARLRKHFGAIVEAWRTFCGFVIEIWGKLSLLTGIVPKEQLGGFGNVDAIVSKTRGLSYSAENHNIFSEAMGLILEFFGINKSLIFSFDFSTFT